MNRKDWGTYYNAIKNEDWEQAKNSLESIYANNRRDERVLLKLGDIYRRVGDSSSAVASYHKSALLLKKNGFIQKALAIYKIILELDPSNEDALKSTAGLLIELDDSKLHKPASAGKYLKTIQESDWLEDQRSIHIPSLFESLPPDEIIYLLEMSTSRRYTQGEIVIKEGNSGNSIFLIQSGKAKVLTRILGQEIELATLSAGDVFGEIGFLTGRPRTASVIAAEKIRVFEFRKSVLKLIFERHPEALKKLHDFYKCRLQDTINKINSSIKK